LWVLGPPQALPTFTTIALDRQRDPAARRIAIEALGGSNDLRAGEALVRLIREDDSKELIRQALPLLARKALGPWPGLARQQQLLEAVARLVQAPELRTEAIGLSRALGTRPLAQWMLSQPFPAPGGAGFSKAWPPEKLEKPEQGRDWTRARPAPDGSI